MNLEELKLKFLLTNREVAEILRTNTATLRKRIQLGMYQGLYRKEGKYTLWNTQSLLSYLNIAI